MKEETKKDIKAFLIWIIVFALIAFLFMPMKKEVYIESPAVMLDEATGEITETKVVFKGEWVWRNIWPFGRRYEGNIIIDALEYTKHEDVFLSTVEFLRFSSTTDGREIKYANYFYNIPGSDSKPGSDGHAMLFTDKDFEKFMFITGEVASDEDFYVVAPAENEEEAKEICSELGMVYPTEYAK